MPFHEPGSCSDEDPCKTGVTRHKWPECLRCYLLQVAATGFCDPLSDLAFEIRIVEL